MWKSTLSGAIKKIKSAPKYLLTLAAVGFVVVTAVYVLQLRGFTHPLKVNDTELRVQLAQSTKDKARGLCCRDNLPENAGMLFVYDEPGRYQFWMKDTRIPLDMYWISTEKEIVHIEHSVQPGSYPRLYGPDIPAQYVLETNAGFAKTHTIQVGDHVNF